MPARKLDAAAGLAFGALVLVGFFLPGTPPKANASSSAIGDYFVTHRAALLAGDALWGVGAIFLVWFAGTLRSHLKQASDDGLPDVVAASGATAAALLIATAAATNALAFKAAGQHDLPLIRALFDLITALFVMTAFAFAAFFAAAACAAARHRTLPRWLAWYLLVAIALDLAAAGALFTTHGALAAGGPVGLLDGIADVIGVGLLSIALLTGPARPSPYRPAS